jgi:hypothetical protein
MPTKTSLGPADDDWNRHLDNKFHDRRKKVSPGWPEKPYPSNSGQKQIKPKPNPHWK